MARPDHKPTAKLKGWVTLAAGAGVPHEQIALALGIARTTLKKHYMVELSTGGAKRRLDMLIALDQAAMRGNVSAMKALIRCWRRGR